MIFIGCAFDPIPYPYNTKDVNVNTTTNIEQSPTQTSPATKEILVLIAGTLKGNKQFRGYYDGSYISVQLSTDYQMWPIEFYMDNVLIGQFIHAKDYKWLTIDGYEIPIYYNWY
jgi:hypothetical protein